MRVFGCQARAGFVIQEVVEIDPEAAVKFEHRQRSRNGLDFLSSTWGCQRQQDAEGKKKITEKSGWHGVVGDVISS